MNPMHSFALIVLLAAGVAVAQTAAPAASAAAAPAPSAATDANCPKPEAHPGRRSTDNQRRGWGKEVTIWETCMKKYVADVQAKADEAVRVANIAVARSNAAVLEFNAVVKDLQEQQDAATK